MISASFIYEPGDYDEEFHRLNAVIEAIAAATEGYIGKESWTTPSGDKVNSTYFWENLAALKVFSRHPRHLEAKRRYKRWYKGFHIVISEVLRSYGDGGLEHLSPNQRLG